MQTSRVSFVATAHANESHQDWEGAGVAMGFADQMRRLDAYMPVSADVSRASNVGGLFTVAAAVLCTVLSYQMVHGYFYEEQHSHVRLLGSDAFTVDINVDLHLYDLPCEFVGIGVWDVLGSDLVSRKTELTDSLTTEDTQGNVKAYTEEEAEALEEIEEEKRLNRGKPKDDKTVEKPDGAGLMADLKANSGDADRLVTMAEFERITGRADFVYIAFMVDWCPYCTRMKPVWQDFAEHQANVAGKDSDLYKQALTRQGRKATFHATAISCERSEKLCTDLGIESYPSVRLYHKTRKFFEKPPAYPSVAEFVRFAVDKVKQFDLVDVYALHHHKMFAKGCRVKGSFSVPAVPGVLKIGPKAHMPKLNQSVNTNLVNVSHEINHLYFTRSGETSTWFGGRRLFGGMDKTKWPVREFHQAPVHHLSIVSVVSSQQDRAFEVTHSHRTQFVKRGETPLIKFQYDVSPIEVVHFSEELTLYHFLTSLIAVVGGTYAVVKMLSQIFVQLA